MNTTVPKLRLVSFKLCPFVQRSVITLKHKQIPYEITYIDLKDPPEWFNHVSPFGKVPVLCVDDTPLFESAVINEYLNDISGGGLLPDDTLQKAFCRGLIELSSESMMSLIGLFRAKDVENYQKKLQTLQRYLPHMETALGNGPYYLGEQFSLVDVAWAPFFMRYELIEQLVTLKLIAPGSKLDRWSRVLLDLEEVRTSVVQEFPSLFTRTVKEAAGYLLTKTD